MARLYKVLIVPGSHGRIRSLSFGRRTLQLVALLGVVLLGGLLLLGHYTWSYHQLVAHCAAVTAKNEILTSNMDVVEDKLNKLMTEQKQVKRLYNKLQTLLFDETGQNNVAIGPLPENPIEHGFTRLILESEKSELERELEILVHKVAAAQRSSQLVEQHLDAFFSYLDERKIKLFATPTIRPIKGWITSPFGYRDGPSDGAERFHEGVDIARPLGTPVVAAADGVVTFSGTYTSYGWMVIIDHGFGLTTRYGHNARNLVQVGDEVKRGEAIAHLGNSGRSTGPHLHYEVRLNGYPADREGEGIARVR